MLRAFLLYGFVLKPRPVKIMRVKTNSSATSAGEKMPFLRKPGAVALKLKLMCMPLQRLMLLTVMATTILAPLAASASQPMKRPVPNPIQEILSADWWMQDAAKVRDAGDYISTAEFDTKDWYEAVVPGTVLTTLVNNKVYPEPLYGENNRPENIPESLARTSWWYRTTIDVPRSYKGQRIWLNFDGINYASTIWLNGTNVVITRGAFVR